MIARVVVGFAALVLFLAVMMNVFSNSSTAEEDAYAPVQAQNAGARAMALAAYQSSAHLQGSSLNVSYTDGTESLTESLSGKTLQIKPSSGTPWSTSIGAGAPLP